MAHIVIIGAGVGGMPAAYELRAQLDAQHRITVINAVDYFQFVPSNPWLAVGWRDRAGISFPVAAYLKRRNIEFIAQRVDKIDAAANTLVLALALFIIGVTFYYRAEVAADPTEIAMPQVRLAVPGQMPLHPCEATKGVLEVPGLYADLNGGPR